MIKQIDKRAGTTEVASIRNPSMPQPSKNGTVTEPQFMLDDEHLEPETVQADDEEPSGGRHLSQILVLMVVLLVLVNIPLNYNGFGLAHLMPETTSIVIREGMLLQGSGPEIYVLEDHKLRQITNPLASSHYFRLNRTRTVDDEFLAQFGQGQPIRHLVKCPDNPHVYALESEPDRQKRWVKDPPTQSRKPWDQVYPVACHYLHQLPLGPPIAEETK